MESQHSFDSGDSSPRSREIDCDDNYNYSWGDEPSSSSSKVKLLCSYGGRIQPRTHDNQLSYLGGVTKILAIDRSIRFTSFNARLAALLPPSFKPPDASFCFKYQLPGEDLDALISVTNDEDLEHMILEYDRLIRPAAAAAAAARPAPRLRLFLFPIPNPDRHCSFLQPLNSTPPDLLFGIDKGFVPPPAVKTNKDPAPVEDRTIGGVSAAVSPAEIQRQIQELKRLQIAAEYQEMQRMQVAAANQELQRLQIVGAENQELHQRMQIAAAAESQELHQRMQIAAAAEIVELQKRLQIAVAAENQELQQRIQIAAAAAAENQELQQRMRAAAENQQQQTTAVFQRNCSDEALGARALTAGGDYYLPRAPEKTAPVTQIPAGYWAEQRVAPLVSNRYASVVGGGEPPRYMIPGPYDGGAAAAAFYPSVPRVVPTSEAYRDGAAVVPPRVPTSEAYSDAAAVVPRMVPSSDAYRDGAAVLPRIVPTSEAYSDAAAVVPRMVPTSDAYRDGAAVVPRMVPTSDAYRDGGAVVPRIVPTYSDAAAVVVPRMAPLASVPFADVGGVATQPQQGVSVTQGYTVAYDSAGRAIYYPGSVVPPGVYHHQAVTSMGPVNPGVFVEGIKIVKPPQVS